MTGFRMALLGLLTCLLASCAPDGEVAAIKKQTSSATPIPSATTNLISGRVGGNNPVLAVKIDDTEPARPQIGLREADVVYIEQVEGGVTRLAAIYSSKLPPKIGPVRSARISDLELLEQYGKVAFAFSGAQRKLRPVIDQANLFNLGAERESAAVYSRDRQRRPPWNMILDPKALFNRAAKRELDIAMPKNMGWNFQKKVSIGEEVIGAKVRWPGARYEINWSQEFGGWLISQNGESKIDASGAPLVASTFIAQVVSITNSEYGDKFGEITPLVATVGQGEAYVFRDGRVIAGSWRRADPASGTLFTTESGEEIAFKPGQIWFALVAKAPDIEYPPVAEPSESASPSPTK